MTTQSPPTLILSSRYTEDSQRLWRAAIQRDWNVERIHGWHVPELLRHNCEPVLYIESLLGLIVAEKLGVTLVETPDNWLPLLPIEYRKREVELAELGTLRSFTKPVFIKPPNEKSFPARVYDPIERPELPDETPVLISEVVKWKAEFRCFLSHGELQTLSVYMRDGVLQQENDFVCSEDESAELNVFVSCIARDQRVQLPSAIVVDVGVIENCGWAVVEANPAWSAGIYGCDPSKVLDVLRHATQK